MTEPSESTAIVSTERLSGWQLIAAGALLAWYFVSSLTAAGSKSASFDEPYHLAGGYTYWMFGDFRIQPENGNLPQRWAALPLLFTEYKFPSVEDPAWRLSQKDTIAPQFLYGVGNDADSMLRRGRAMIALLGVALGAVVFGWTRRLFGVAGAFISLTLYVFCPTLLTNGALTTSDMTAALFFTATVACLWTVLHRVTWRTLLLSSLVMGGLFVSKFSAPMILIIGGLLVVAQFASRHPLVVSWRDKTWDFQSRGGRLLAQLAVVGFHVLVVWIVIWTCYNFRYEMFHPAMTALDPARGEPALLDTMGPSWEALLERETGVLRPFFVRSRQWRLLPEAYLYGFACVRYFAQQRPAFLNGEFRATGWWQFFPYCLLVKTPLTLFALMALGAIAICKSWWSADDGSGLQPRERIIAGLYRAAPLWSLFLVYWAFAITSHLNIGHRHLLPTYPAMIILAGGSALWFKRLVPRESPEPTSQSSPAEAPHGNGLPNWLKSRRYPALAIATLSCVGLFSLESVLQWPNYLTYFNQTIGGQQYAYRHLVDSSLDWGQELPALKQWLAEQGLDQEPAKVYLSFFGVGDPHFYGIEATRLPSILPPPNYVPALFDEGTYCISATMLQQVYSPLPLRWNPEYERLYQMLVASLREFARTANDPQGRQRLIAQFGGEAGWNQAVTVFPLACYARLCSYLRQREPDAEINGSILIYRVSRTDLQAALEGPPPESAPNPPTQADEKH